MKYKAGDLVLIDSLEISSRKELNKHLALITNVDEEVQMYQIYTSQYGFDFLAEVFLKSC